MIPGSVDDLCGPVVEHVTTDAPTFRLCLGCRNVLSLDDFTVARRIQKPGKPDRPIYFNYCRSCRAAVARYDYAANPNHRVTQATASKRWRVVEKARRRSRSHLEKLAEITEYLTSVPLTTEMDDAIVDLHDVMMTMRFAAISGDVRGATIAVGGEKPRA